MHTRKVSLVTVFLIGACATDPPEATDEPLSEEETALTRRAVENAVEAVSEVTTMDLSLNATRFRRLRCATVDTDRRTYLTVTYDCTRPFAIEGTVHYERATPEIFNTIVDLTVETKKIDSVASLFIPRDRTQARTYDGVLVVDGPTRDLEVLSHASWVHDGRCIVLDAVGSVTLNGTTTRMWDFTGKRICRRFHH